MDSGCCRQTVLVALEQQSSFFPQVGSSTPQLLTVTRCSGSERRDRINLFVPAAPVPERLPGVRDDMLTVRVGRTKMQTQMIRSLLKILTVLVPAVVITMLILEQNNLTFINEWRRTVYVVADTNKSSQTPEKLPKATGGGCFMDTHCPDYHISFYMKSGEENVMGPKICIQNKVVLGMMLNNAGQGLNIVVLNGKTGNITQTGHFHMYNNEVEALIKFLKSIEEGSIVLIASWDEPSSNLNDEAKKLMADLGSSAVHSLGYRDNWLFVGGKGATVKSKFEKHLKNEKKLNEKDNWSDFLELKGCILKSMN